MSGEAPSFKTKTDSEDMVVVVTPEKAEIVGADPKYLVGDTVNATCISTGSKPAASLTWKVNGVEVRLVWLDNIWDFIYLFCLYLCATGKSVVRVHGERVQGLRRRRRRRRHDWLRARQRRQRPRPRGGRLRDAGWPQHKCKFNDMRRSKKTPWVDNFPLQLQAELHQYPPMVEGNLETSQLGLTFRVTKQGREIDALARETK